MVAYTLLVLMLSILLVYCNGDMNGDPSTDNRGSNESWLGTVDDQPEPQTCSNNFFLMEQSLLENTDNRFNLLKAFYPPTEAHPVLVRVNYTFMEYWNESQVWYWTESEFYLIQPLEVFQFTSLLFSNMPYRRKDLSITLDTDCTQAPSEYFLLLTQRLQLYAQSPTTGPQAPTQRVSSSYTAVAVSITDVQKDTIQSTFVKVWLHLILVIFPILSWLLLYLCDPVQLLLGDKTWTKLEDEQTHGTLAAMIQISVVFTTFILVLDVLGIYYTVTNNFDDVIMTTQHTAFYLSTVTGIIVDKVAFLWVVGVIIKAFKASRNTNHSNAERLGESAFNKNFFFYITISPMLCLASHLHYIIIAFMSDPFHAGSIAIMYFLSLFLFYFSFRQFYNKIARFEHSQKPSMATNLLNFLWRKFKKLFRIKTDNRRTTRHCCITPTAQGTPVNHSLNIRAIVLGLVVMGPLLVIYEAIIIALFLALPLSKAMEDAPSRVYTIYQGTGFLIVALLTYNILLKPAPYSVGKIVEKLAGKLNLPATLKDSEKLDWKRLTTEEKMAKVIVALLPEQWRNTKPTRTYVVIDENNNQEQPDESPQEDGAVINNNTAATRPSAPLQEHRDSTVALISDQSVLETTSM